MIVETDLATAGKSDNLEDSINYGELFEVCKDVTEGKPYKLVEAVAEKIASELLAGFSKVRTCTVKVI